jgi:hypothetical protein
MHTNTIDKANGLFSKFCDMLGDVDLRLAVMVPAGIGAVVALAGVMQEAHGQAELLKTSGMMALDAYKAAMQQWGVDNGTILGPNEAGKELAQWIGHAIKGNLPSFGGNTQGVGAAMVLAMTPLSAATVMLARGFRHGRSMLSEKLAAFKDMASSKMNLMQQPLAAAPASWPTAPDLQRQLMSRIPGVIRSATGDASPRSQDTQSEDDEDTPQAPRM